MSKVIRVNTDPAKQNGRSSLMVAFLAGLVASTLLFFLNFNIALVTITIWFCFFAFAFVMQHSSGVLVRKLLMISCSDACLTLRFLNGTSLGGSVNWSQVKSCSVKTGMGGWRVSWFLVFNGTNDIEKGEWPKEWRLTWVHSFHGIGKENTYFLPDIFEIPLKDLKEICDAKIQLQ
ncbi:MAG: hypothetical protein NT027_11370 [Proteobacteria bacterium]|nr:hypothetical protein [Pseudomonadota bacterium]